MKLWLSTLKDFWQRYAVTWKNVWQIREELEPVARNRDEKSFLPAHLELVETPVSVAPKIVVRTIMLFTLVTLVWAIVGQIDIVAVTQGKTIPGGHSKSIQSLETSVVKQILVKNGDHVEVGQLLIEVSVVGSDNDYLQSRKLLAAAYLMKYRNEALLLGLEKKVLPVIDKLALNKESINNADIVEAESLAHNQYQTWSIQDKQFATILEQHKAELRASESQIIKLENIGAIENQRLSDFKKLLDKNFLSQHEYYQQQSKCIENSHDLKSQRNTAQQINETINQVDQERQLYLQTLKRDTLDALRQANENVNQLTEQMLKTKQRQEFMFLRSPISGTVQQLVIHTVGGVAMEGQTLMMIAPTQDKIDVEVLIANKDIGFVKPGMDAVVKIESFPYTRYGYVTGKVKHVSFDAIEDEKLGLVFSGLVTLDQSSINVDNVKIPLTAGMSVTAEIKTGKRHVIDYLLSPLQTKIDESFKER